jgi:hypothetical protein
MQVLRQQTHKIMKLPILDSHGYMLLAWRHGHWVRVTRSETFLRGALPFPTVEFLGGGPLCLGAFHPLCNGCYNFIKAHFVFAHFELCHR